MTKEELQSSLEDLKKGLETAITEKSKTEITAQIKAVEEKINEKFTATETITKDVTDIKESVKVMKDAADKNQAAIDKLIADNQAKNLFGNQIDKESFRDGLKRELKAKENELKNYKSARNSINVEVKAVGDIASGNFTSSGTQTFAGPTIIPGVQRYAINQNRLRDIIGTTQVNSDSVAVIRSTAGEGGPTTVPAGALKPQSDLDWVKVIIPITKIAHYYTIPEEYLEDISWLSDDITQTGVAELMKIENEKLISQTAGSGVFGGLIQNSTAYAAPSGLALGVEAANNYDVLVSAMTQLRNAYREPNFIVTDNDSYARMILTKATTGEYVFGAPNVSIPNVFGVPIYPIAVSTLADKFIVGDSNYATVAVRSGISVRFYDQHANNAIYNLVTVVIEERLALVVKRTDAFVYGDFSDSRTALETA